MPHTLPDLFPGFATERIAHDGLIFYMRIGGAGPPLVCLHGYPQTHACWHRVASRLAERHTVIAMDLRGYGASSAPSGDAGHQRYSKRAMARDVVAVMAALGHTRFHVLGHDRGARVAYRLALDTPDAIDRLVVLDILPTVDVWDAIRWQSALKSYHWAFLAQPHPMPETLISAAPHLYVDHTLASWTRDKTLAAFDPSALAHYRALLTDPARVHAVCEDYRAGATFDRTLDAADRDAGRTIRAPTLLLWGSDYIGKGSVDPIIVWRSWAPDVTGTEIVSGHFLVEENPDAVLAAVMPFLGAE